MTEFDINVDDDQMVFGIKKFIKYLPQLRPKTGVDFY